MSCIDCGNLKEFKISDLTPIGWATMEWPNTEKDHLNFPNKLVLKPGSPLPKNCFVCFNDNNKNITREIFSFKNHAENEAGGLVPDPFLFFFKKALCDVKVICSLAPIYFNSPQLGIM